MIAFLYSVFLIFIIFYELFRKKNRKIDYLTLLNIYYTLYYIIPPIITNLVENYRSKYYIYIGKETGTVFGFVLIFLSYLLIIIGFSIKKNITIINKKEIKQVFINNTKKMQYLCYGLFIVGVMSLFLYSLSFGGFSNLFFNSALIRDNAYQIANNSSFFQFASRFITCLQLSCIIAIGLYWQKKINKFFYVIIFIFAIISLIVHAGRGALLSFFLIIFLSFYESKNKRITIKHLIFMAIICALGVLFLRPFFVSIRYFQYGGLDGFVNEFSRIINSSSTFTSTENSFFKLVNYFEHKFISTELAIKMINSGTISYRFFNDFLLALVTFIPSSLLNFVKPTSISDINTILITGDSSLSNGVIPPGGVAFGYYSFGILGVILYSFIMGRIGRRLFNFFSKYDKSDKCMILLKYYSIFTWIDFFINGDLRQWLLRNFLFFIVIFVIKFNSISEVKEDNE